MPEPLSLERLEEIRDLSVDSCSADAPYNPDVWALEKARTDLLAEVDRHKAETDGAAVAEQEPMRIAPTVFMVETEENVGATLLQMIDQDGREVYVGLDDHMRDLLVSMLVRNGGAADV